MVRGSVLCELVWGHNVCCVPVQNASLGKTHAWQGPGLYAAARDGDVDLVLQLLAEGANVAYTREVGHHPAGLPGLILAMYF